MPIAIFCGETKPLSLEDFLRPFVNDLADVMVSGVIINDQKITVRLRCIICDSPARAFIKGIIAKAFKFIFLLIHYVFS